jgi:hypothetical protein
MYRTARQNIIQYIAEQNRTVLYLYSSDAPGPPGQQDGGGQTETHIRNSDVRGEVTCKEERERGRKRFSLQ